MELFPATVTSATMTRKIPFAMFSTVVSWLQLRSAGRVIFIEAFDDNGLSRTNMSTRLQSLLSSGYCIDQAAAKQQKLFNT